MLSAHLKIKFSRRKFRSGGRVGKLWKSLIICWTYKHQRGFVSGANLLSCFEFSPTERCALSLRRPGECVCVCVCMCAGKGSDGQVKQSSVPKGAAFVQASISEHMQGDQFLLGVSTRHVFLRWTAVSVCLHCVAGPVGASFVKYC